IAGAVAFAACCATSAAAQGITNPTPCDETRYPTLLTVEGGGSLGVYEAGMTYLLVDVFKRKWRHWPVSPRIDRLLPLCLSVATGASAGNINSFLAAANWCDVNVDPSPEKSLFWTAWIT